MGSRGAKSGIINRVPNANNATIADGKITNWLLSPDKKHYQDFVDVGYSKDKPERLRKDLLNGIKNNEAMEHETNEHGEKTYNVDMLLGVTKKRKFRTGWQIDKGSAVPRLVTAFKIGAKRK